jgi:UDP-N-acetylmuramoylalanine--D-glutamate ligase
MDLPLMDKARLKPRHPDLGGLRVLIVGAGRSGLAAARLAASRQAVVTMCDREPIESIAEAVREARELGAEVHAGGHPPALADDADLVIVSPGVPTDIALLARARRRQLPVWGEVELAARFCRGRIIGVTGSNGKSTVTTMVGGILRGAGVGGGTGGNLDRPLAELLEHDAPEAWHALELSSFQLDTVETLCAEVAVVLNLSPDHLDRHRSLDAYARAKARLLELQDSEGYAVLNADDGEVGRFRAVARGRLHLFSTRTEPAPGAFVRASRLMLHTEQGEDDLLGIDELPLPGEHNLANALAAAVACRLAGCDPEAIARGLREYRPLPHRLELVADVNGVRFYDDSKATNPAAAACALTAFPAGSIHLVLGGRDKGADWSALAEAIRSRVRRVLLVGEAAPKLRRLLAGSVPVRESETVPRAVADAFDGAVAGDAVLLAPGCASFDQYRNFAERGDDFRRAARSLRDPERSDG